MSFQPKGNAPVSRDVVEVVKRKLAPPMGPPPAGMANFKPKTYAPQEKSQYEDDELSDDDGYYNYKSDNRNGSSRYRDDGRDSRDDGRDTRDNSPPRYGRNHRDDDRYDDYRDQDNERGWRESSAVSKSRYDDDDYDDNRSSRSRSPFEQDDKPSDDNHHNQKIGVSTRPTKQYGGSSSSGKKSPDPFAPDSKGTSNDQQPGSKQGKKGRSANFNFSPILRATYRELKDFVCSPCPKGFVIRCYIERNRSGTKMLAPQYSICADLEDGTGRELMVCKKVMYSQSSHYIFSLKADDLQRKREQRSRLYLGKLRAISSNDFVLFDNGICSAPEGSGCFDEDDVGEGMSGKPGRNEVAQDGDNSLYRKELLSIHFNSKTRPAPQGMRGTEVCIPNPASIAAADSSSSGQNNMYSLSKPFEKIRKSGKQNEMHAKSFYVLHERTSRYDPLSSCLVDFKGRANVASVKNCQFVHSTPLFGIFEEGQTVKQSVVDELQKDDSEKEFILQLGKTTEDCFNMDFRYPLSLLQAFAMCMARFDSNLSW